MINKKAQAEGMIIFLVIGVAIAIIFAIVAIPISKAFDDVADELKKPENFGSSNVTVENINQVQGLVTPAYDQLVFMILIGIILGTFAIALFSDFHPVTLALFIIAIVFTIIIAGLMANVYDDVKTNELLSDKGEEFKFTNTLMGKQLPIIIIIVGVIGVIIMLGKRGRLVSPV